MNCAINKHTLAELARTRAIALRDNDAVLDDEASERLMSAALALLETGQAAEVIAEATDALAENFAAVDALHEMVQSVVEEDESSLAHDGVPFVDRLVLLPMAISRGDSKAPCPGELAREQLEPLEVACAKNLDPMGYAKLRLCGYFYDSAQLTRASYDQLYNLMPALSVEELSDEERSRLRLQEGARPVEKGHGVVRYLVGVLSAPAQVDADFVFNETATPEQGFFGELAKELLDAAFDKRWTCLQCMELAPFFEGITMGEHFAREAAFTMNVLAGLNISRVSPRATMAHISMPAGEEIDRVEVQLIGMDSVPVASAFWDVLEPADPEGEITQLLHALERIGVRTGPDASVVTGYGTA